MEKDKIKIKLENLSFRYPTLGENSVSDISLEIFSGEFITVCGVSGCGKTTLLRSLKPQIAPKGGKTGKILYDGAELSALSQREQAEKIGFVMQDAESQTVCDKVWHEMAFGLESLGYSKAEIRGRVAETAAFFGLQSIFHQKTACLSGGQKQLLNLASVMVMRPEVLILDEPTAQLDPIAARRFLETVSRINKEIGTTVILSEHRLEEVLPLSDRVLVMEDGRTVVFDFPKRAAARLKELENPMLSAFPVPVRIYYSKESGFDAPLTVCEGREWLKNLENNIEKQIKFSEKAEKNPAEPKRAALELKEVWFRYEKNSADVLKGASLKAFEGEIYAVLGDNGAGKSTLLSLCTGLNKPLSGKVCMAKGKKAAALLQNPKSIFTEKTLLLDLLEGFGETSDKSREQKEAEILEKAKFFGIESLLNRHPYDLSGGEAQRAALEKVLLSEPDILILDEPTKGLDFSLKKRLADLLSALKKSGIAVIIVSHDVEFCAEYADRCGMLFDGKITAEGEPREFFGEKYFYTTAASRMTRGIIEGAVLKNDIVRAIGGKEEKEESGGAPVFIRAEKDEPQKTDEPKKKKITKKNIIFGSIFATLFAFVQFKFCGGYDIKSCLMQAMAMALLGGALLNFIPQREFGIKEIQKKTDERKISKRAFWASAAVLIAVPLTILSGIYYLGDRKYYFISLLIIFEILLPFVFAFEGKKNGARDIVVLSVLCAIAVAGRAAFSPFPQFKPMAAVVIITAVCLGGEAGFLVGALSGFVSNFYFGQGPWTPWQMFAFGILGLLAGALFKKGILRKTKAELAVFGFLSVFVLYGLIMNIAAVLMSQPYPKPGMFLTSVIMGMPFDLVHGAATAFFLWFGAEPMCEKIDRIRVKYGLME